MKYFWKKILTSNDLKISWWVSANSFKKRLSYNLKTGKLTKIRKWLYVFTDQIENLWSEDYLIIANSIYNPSYISFETVLNREWINFQYYKSLFVASKYKKEVIIPLLDLNISFYKIPDSLLLDNLWIIHSLSYDIASKERSICDVMLRSPDYYFDNLSSVNKDTLLWIARIYDRVKKWFYKKILNLINKHE
jgi:predicted transcriptional regulator of viral defense system